MGLARTPRQASILESVRLGEVGYTPLLGGFYFNRRLQLQLADEDQAYLRALYEADMITHQALNENEFRVRLPEDTDGE